MKVLLTKFPPAEVGVITPYAAQATKIASHLERYPNVEISTVDSFQGREKSAIVLSMVRSNDKCSAGFTGDARRLNVSITRAKEVLVVIGDAETLKADPLLKKYIGWLNNYAIVITPYDY